MLLRSIFVLAILALGGCECASDCDDFCGACPSAISLDVIVPGGAEPTIEGTPALNCETASSMTHCEGDAMPGDYTYTISAPGRAPQEITLTVGLPRTEDACCSCGYEPANETVSFEILDAGDIADAAVVDAGMSVDAGPDAGMSDGGTCNPEDVAFPMGGELSPGTLCDDVFLCAPDANYAARVVAASDAFNCTGVDGMPCEGVLCRYEDNGGAGPSTLDATEVANICAVTLLDPEPITFLCRVYL